jgi:hypothetical protein
MDNENDKKLQDDKTIDIVIKEYNERIEQLEKKHVAELDKKDEIIKQLINGSQKKVKSDDEIMLENIAKAVKKYI